MIDVAYPLGRGSTWQNNELRYSLRSVERFVPDVRNVLIAAKALPPFLAGAVHVRKADTLGLRTMNTLAKALAVCAHPLCAEKVLWLHDDMLLRAPLDVTAYHHKGGLGGLSSGGEYQRAAQHSAALLKARGIAYPLNFAAHRPILLDRDLFLELMTPLLKGKPLLWGTVYCNLARVAGVLSTDAKVRTPEAFFAAVGRGAPLISTDAVVVKNPTVRAWFPSEYPEPSRFEQEAVPA